MRYSSGRRCSFQVFASVTFWPFSSTSGSGSVYGLTWLSSWLTPGRWAWAGPTTRERITSGQETAGTASARREVRMRGAPRLSKDRAGPIDLRPEPPDLTAPTPSRRRGRVWNHPIVTHGVQDHPDSSNKARNPAWRKCSSAVKASVKPRSRMMTKDRQSIRPHSLSGRDRYKSNPASRSFLADGQDFDARVRLKLVNERDGDRAIPPFRQGVPDLQDHCVRREQPGSLDFQMFGKHLSPSIMYIRIRNQGNCI